jgi:hypothetical protein
MTLKDFSAIKTTPAKGKAWRVVTYSLLAAGLVVASQTTDATSLGGSRVRTTWDWAHGGDRPAAGANGAVQQRVPLVRDFSNRHVIFPESVPASRVNAIRADSRAWQQYLHRHAHRYVPFDRDHVEDPLATSAITRDWSFSLNNGSGGTISAPAKYVFDVNAPPSCTTDFVVTGVNIAGSATQANIVGLNSLYNTPTGTGLCPGTAPLVMFAYNVGPGSVSSYLALSLDGTKFAFSENNGASSYFHVLRWATGAGNGTSASAPATPGTGNAAVDTKLPIAGGSSTAPFVDYDNDVAYVTTSNNVVHKFTGVFRGTPQEVTAAGTGWPNTPGVTGLSTPVFDSVSRHVFFEDSSTGGINYVDDSVVPAVAVTNKFFFAPGLTLSAPVLVDSGNQKVYAFSANTNGSAAVVAQADTNLSAASQVTVSIGGATSNRNPLTGDFNEAYYDGATASARLYVVGNDSSPNRVPALFSIGFNAAYKLNPAVTNGPVALSTNTAGVSASPVTAFFNSTLGKQFVFVSVTNACSAAIPGGCIRSIDVTNNAFPTAGTINSVVFAAAGGTGGISIDNVSASAGASSVYYTTLTGRTIVKATQALLQ